MINAGAILTCSLMNALVKPDMTSAEIFDYTMSWFKRLSECYKSSHICSAVVCARAGCVCVCVEKKELINLFYWQ